MEPKIIKETEHRSTFKAQITEVSGIRTAMSAKCYLLNIVLETHRIGGLIEQTWGLKVKGKPEKIEEFGQWLQETLPGLCQPEKNFLSRIIS